MSGPSIPYVYPDNLISGSFLNYSDGVLNKKHAAQFTTSTGFQDVIGERSSGTHRTRASEIFSLGLLRGSVINPQAARADEIPYGWQLIQSDQNIHTRLGYCAYALGRAIKRGADSQEIANAIDALAVIFLLQIGFLYQGNRILLSSIFKHVIQSFMVPTGTDIITWYRYVSVALFCTFREDRSFERAVDAYLAGDPIIQLIWTDSNENSQSVDATQLQNLISTGVSLNDVKGPKNSLFWIGNPSSILPRGHFSSGYRCSPLLIDKAYEIERQSIDGGNESPFRVVIDKPHGQEIPDILHELGNIFHSELDTEREWERVMETLYEGVIESLAYLDTQIGPEFNRIMFAHEVREIDRVSEQVVFDVSKDACAAEPRDGDTVVIFGVSYSIDEVQEIGDEFRIGATKIP